MSWPGVFVFGSRRRRGRKEFVAARAGLAAVVLDAEGVEWDRVVVSHPEAVQIAAELAALLLAGPLPALLTGAFSRRGPSLRGHGGIGDGTGTTIGDGRRRSLQNGSSGLTHERAGRPARGRARGRGAVPAGAKA